MPSNECGLCGQEASAIDHREDIEGAHAFVSQRREMRTFATGATRDNEEGKAQYEGYMSPLVIQEFGRYMLKHQKQADGRMRASDNWQKGISRQAYADSLWRHFEDWWLEHRGYESREGLEDALCGMLFNVMGYLHEVLLKRDVGKESAQ